MSADAATGDAVSRGRRQSRLPGVSHPRFGSRRGAVRPGSWWARAWVRALEESAYAAQELRAARSMARAGGIGSLTTEPGRWFAAVADRDDLHTVQGSLPVLDPGACQALVELVAAEAGRLPALLAGELPHTLVEHAEEAGVELLPYGGELGAACGCDAWTDPCVHALAVGYQLGWLVDIDPLVLFQLRGLPREGLLASLHALRGLHDADGSELSDLDTAVAAAVAAQRLLAEVDVESGAPGGDDGRRSESCRDSDQRPS